MVTILASAAGEDIARITNTLRLSTYEGTDPIPVAFRIACIRTNIYVQKKVNFCFSKKGKRVNTYIRNNPNLNGLEDRILWCM